MNTNKAMLLALLTITAGINCLNGSQGNGAPLTTNNTEAEQLDIEWKKYCDLWKIEDRTTDQDKELEAAYVRVHDLHSKVNFWTASAQKWVGGSGAAHAFGFKYKSKLRLLTQAVQVGAEVAGAVAATAWALGYKLMGKSADEEEELDEVL
ncbi:hypothetical protein IPH25_01965 [bacterium]|nr:MAG: hypothetical protein IPG37_04095 [bacterium]QQR62190.1 MAG: hypothetical protein IPH25_01965 [bacterium]QQR63252.1 MAG: hypothetical protein IPH67_02135 [bacterium]